MITVLLLSASSSAINVIKSLGSETGVQLLVTDADKYAPGLYVDGIKPFVIPRARDISSYRSTLDRIIHDYNVNILIPTSDHDMAAIMRLRADGWSCRAKMFKPPQTAFRRLINKRSLTEYLSNERPDLIPKTWFSRKDIQLPVVIKPKGESGAKGVRICRSRVQLDEAWDHCVSIYGEEPIAQEYIPGGPGSMHVAVLLYDSDGEYSAGATSVSTRTLYTWGGGGIAGYEVVDDDLLEKAREVIDLGGGWCGPINLEFKLCASTNKFFLIEVNARLNGYSYLTTMNGLDLPRRMLEILTNGVFKPREMSRPRCWDGNFVLGFREKVLSTEPNIVSFC